MGREYERSFPVWEVRFPEVKELIDSEEGSFLGENSFPVKRELSTFPVRRELFSRKGVP